MLIFTSICLPHFPQVHLFLFSVSLLGWLFFLKVISIKLYFGIFVWIFLAFNESFAIGFRAILKKKKVTANFNNKGNLEKGQMQIWGRKGKTNTCVLHVSKIRNILKDEYIGILLQKNPLLSIYYLLTFPCQITTECNNDHTPLREKRLFNLRCPFQ